MSNIQAIRGMNDLLPTQTPYWQYLEQQIHQLVHSAGYQELRTPIIESTQLFTRTIGQVTDIVEKEMYTFDDRNGDSLSLRPEETASCVRAAIEHGLLYHQTPRLWYIGPMFRHERPQKGRYRQFYQLDVEAFGMPGPDIDAEQIILMHQLWQRLGISDVIRLEINSLGVAETRQAYRAQLVEYFSRYENSLDEDSKRRLQTNPLRILDSKNPALQEIIAQAPSLLEVLDEDSKQHFAKLQQLLKAAGIEFTVNPRLVRGLDYYGKTVYEWITNELGAQGTVCAGGRYDALVEQLGGKPTPAVGFAMGLERVVSLLQDRYTPNTHLDGYFVLIGEAAVEKGLIIAAGLRKDLPSIRLLTHCGGGSFKSQFKQADKSGSRLAFIIADEELAANKISVKFLRENKEQISIHCDDLTSLVSKLINEPGAVT